jgi:LCP family protein required for cell wall assembly
MSDAAQPPAQPELPSPYDPEGGRRGKHGKRRGRTRRSHTVAKVLLATLLTLGMVSGLSVAFLYRHLNGNLNVVDYSKQVTNTPDKPKVEGPHEPLNILVMGDDSRSCDGCKIDNEAGEGGSDTTILFHLSADRKSAYGISIPRDSLVDRPECTKSDGTKIPGGSDAMWNAAYAYGGAPCTIQQFQADTGIPVDDFIVVDFASFQSMVDAIGGVEVCVPEDIDSSQYGITIKQGTRTLDGKQALAYVRVRHGVGDGSDIGRIKRQQAFIAAMVEKVVSGGVLARPDRLIRFLNAATQSLTTDIPSIKELAEIGLQFKNIGLSRIRFITVPFEYEGARVRWTSDADVLWKKILNDQPLGKLRDGSIGANNVPGQKGSSSASPSGSASGSASDSPSSSASSSPSSSASSSGSASSSSSSSPSSSASSSDSIDPSSEDLASVGLCS